MWRDQWVTRWNYHLLAQPGYIVLLTNYTGSTGYGEKLAQQIQGDPQAVGGGAAEIAVEPHHARGALRGTEGMVRCICLAPASCVFRRAFAGLDARGKGEGAVAA